MKIILVDTNLSVVQAWKEIFRGVSDNISIIHGSIFDVECDTIVSPANSFGFMDGGIDLVISEYFGWHIEEHLQKLIKSIPVGELLVGQAALIETGDARIPSLISAPTMRVPLEIQNTVNIYLAMKAILTVANDSVVEVLAIPGLGTGCGQVDPTSSARQMLRAFEEINGESQYPNNWLDAQNQHCTITKL